MQLEDITAIRGKKKKILKNKSILRWQEIHS